MDSDVPSRDRSSSDTKMVRKIISEIPRKMITSVAQKNEAAEERRASVQRLLKF